MSKIEKPKPRFQNVAVPVDDHTLLRELAEVEQRSMARELSVLIREAHRQIVQGHPV